MSALDTEAVERARRLVAGPARRERLWPVVAAAALAAATALGFATAMILAPPVVTQHVVETVE
ncbi:hypothetical protein [Phenylobacterium sp. J367]|uniref:hypothetical protein n=1 Tax=Phenylobacterium sp. J367 TaxID=2898435 RepID=UPI002150F3E7|nr:hypothetical protein [Phenylobacterium sp. J367]MCR5880452.1 hypothetical protein [Phenylobacterium sp. J367]